MIIATIALKAITPTMKMNMLKFQMNQNPRSPTQPNIIDHPDTDPEIINEPTYLHLSNADDMCWKCAAYDKSENSKISDLQCLICS